MQFELGCIPPIRRISGCHTAQAPGDQRGLGCDDYITAETLTLWQLEHWVKLGLPSSGLKICTKGQM